LYFLGYNEEGQLVVSSWGEKYIFDATNAEWVSKLTFEIK